MGFAFPFLSFLVPSSNLFGLLDTMAITLKLVFFVSSISVTWWKSLGLLKCAGQLRLDHT